MDTPSITLPEDIAAKIYARVSPIVASNGSLATLPYNKYRNIASQVYRILYFSLPLDALAEIENLPTMRGGEGFALIRGLKLEDESKLPPTPDARVKSVDPHFGEYLLAGVSYRHGNFGEKPFPAHLVRDEDPEKPGYATVEPPHTHPENRLAGFFFNRGHDDAPTIMLTAERLFKAAPDDVKERLLQPLHYWSGDQEAVPFLVEEAIFGKLHFHPIIAQSHDLEEFCRQIISDRPLARSTSVARHVIECLADPEITYSHTARAGDLFLADQTACVRGAPAYKMNAPENERWADFIGFRPYDPQQYQRQFSLGAGK